MTEHKNLIEALTAFQQALPELKLDGMNPHFKSKFATLGNISKTVLPRLAQHGLSFTAMPTLHEGKFVLYYALSHTSGDKLEGFYPLNDGNDQARGSSITYARRYVLAAITGVAAEDDDDGNASTHAHELQANAPKPASPPANWQSTIANTPTVNALTALFKEANAQGWATEEVTAALYARKSELENENPVTVGDITSE